MLLDVRTALFARNFWKILVRGTDKVSRRGELKMSKISDYTDDTELSANDFKQNFDLVSPEEIQYHSESLLRDFEELNRKACLFGLPIPQRVMDLRKWVEENLHPQLQMSEHEATFFHDIIAIRKVINCFLRRRTKKLESFLHRKSSSMWGESIMTLLSFLAPEEAGLVNYAKWLSKSFFTFPKHVSSRSSCQSFLREKLFNVLLTLEFFVFLFLLCNASCVTIFLELQPWCWETRIVSNWQWRKVFDLISFDVLLGGKCADDRQIQQQELDCRNALLDRHPSHLRRSRVQ